MDTDFAKELAQGSGKIFKGVGLLALILAMTIGSIIGVATPVLNKYADIKGFEKKLNEQAGKMIQMNESLSFAMESNGALMADMRILQEKMTDYEIQISGYKQAMLVKDSDIDTLKDKISVLELKNEELINRITSLKLKDGSTRSFN